MAKKAQKRRRMEKNGIDNEATTQWFPTVAEG